MNLALEIIDDSEFYGLTQVAKPREKRLLDTVAEQTEVRKRKRDACLIEADKRLFKWAEWARENRQALGYPTISSLFRVMMDSKRNGEETKEERAERRRLEIKRREGKLFMVWGKQTKSFRDDNHFIPEIVAEIDRIVARLPAQLERIVTAYYFTYGPIETRAKAAGLKKARFCQLLEAAKYSVWTALNTTQEEFS